VAYKKGETYLPNTMRSENRWLLKLRYVDWVVSIEIAVDRDRPRTLNELKTAITAYIRNISQADLQKEFANKIKRVQVCIDAYGHLFRHLL
jgi:deoxyhypusine synthase